MGIFIVQGALNGVLGCLLGAGLGVLVASNLSQIALFIEQLFAVKFLSTDVYFIDFLPSKLMMQDVGLVVSLAFAMSLIATLYPA